MSDFVFRGNTLIEGNFALACFLGEDSSGSRLAEYIEFLVEDQSENVEKSKSLNLGTDLKYAGITIGGMEYHPDLVVPVPAESNHFVIGLDELKAVSLYEVKPGDEVVCSNYDVMYHFTVTEENYEFDAEKNSITLYAPLTGTEFHFTPANLMSGVVSYYGVIERYFEHHSAFHEYNCHDCKLSTLYVGEYYMVHNELWDKAYPEHDGMLCIACLEKRVGRALTRDDFTDALVNWIGGLHNANSPLLTSRLEEKA